ncbi:MAG TPA: TauD/TfdA family dioxygenase [Leptolyngbyaceae cyanobacterium M33_DOE_097]|uniref:TauD/TfdA family dioxygenase n=1 Tax=Oscillatoriales cyanobacterium SpSt-418 TaxID=2282169 RepID=A0A7C3KDC6_9CYAN|nr:TauD/TfdA family dioxygenase [Leptolyngbyaceae cyanobacterium M33_DOE_097]
MKTVNSLYIQPLSETVGKEIINIENIDILSLNKESIINLFQSEGVLLFRGFETDIETFSKFTNQFSENFMDYAGGVFNRRTINGDSTVLSVNDFKHEIKLHGEMYYQKNIPLMLWFFCIHPPVQAGETIICDGKSFFAELSQPLKELFSQKKLKYRGFLDKETWKRQYKTDDLNILKQVCKSNDTQLQINQDESINIQYICPAIRPNRSGEYLVFINSLLPAKSMAPSSISFEDDSEIDDEIMIELNEIAEKITAEICWEKGDILMIDNTRIMHGRRAFSDDKRDICLRLCSPSFS